VRTPTVRPRAHYKVMTTRIYSELYATRRRDITTSNNLLLSFAITIIRNTSYNTILFKRFVHRIWFFFAHAVVSYSVLSVILYWILSCLVFLSKCDYVFITMSYDFVLMPCYVYLSHACLMFMCVCHMY